jgi:hypothetical protein
LLEGEGIMHKTTHYRRNRQDRALRELIAEVRALRAEIAVRPYQPAQIVPMPYPVYPYPCPQPITPYNPYRPPYVPYWTTTISNLTLGDGLVQGSANASYEIEGNAGKLTYTAYGTGD